LAWRLPCISPAQVQADRITHHGESWQWHEFAITAYHLPGQTEYHGGLLVEGRGQRILLCGDSFTMAGIDDYCAGNRNWLGPGVGFEACLDLIEAIQPDLILNCHVDVGWVFGAAQLAAMRANLSERVSLYRELLPWDDPNYGLDESWVRCDPYEQHVSPGGPVRMDVAITNHSEEARWATCLPTPPPEWGVQLQAGSAKGAAKSEFKIPFAWTVPQDAVPGRYVVPIVVTYGGRRLGQFREAIVEVL
jgi:hypothetical protein